MVSFFPEMDCVQLETEGIKYAGSKLKLLPMILELAKRVPAASVLDGFSGTTRVSQAFAQSGYQVWSNDTAIWSEVFGTCYLLNTKSPTDYRGLIEHLNAVPCKEGWFTEHYGGVPNEGSSVQEDGLKKPWQRHNTLKLDGIREEIENLELGEVERAVALTSLILALDAVDNTLGHYASYLNEWSPRSYNPLRLQIPKLSPQSQKHSVTRHDIFELLPNVRADIAYFDPPYGSNNEKMPPSRVRYNAYYHLWKSVCLFDRPPLFGKAKRRLDSSDSQNLSLFEEFRCNDAGRYIAVEAIERLVQEVQTPWVLLSYSSGGRATAHELNEVLQRNGRILEVMEVDYKRNVMAEMRWTHAWTREAEVPNREFLFLLEKT